MPYAGLKRGVGANWGTDDSGFGSHGQSGRTRHGYGPEWLRNRNTAKSDAVEPEEWDPVRPLSQLPCDCVCGPICAGARIQSDPRSRRVPGGSEHASYCSGRALLHDTSSRNSASALEVSAVAGEAEVRNDKGLLIAKVFPGAALDFDQQPGGAAGPSSVSGKVSKTSDGHYLLTDSATNTTVEVQGDNLESTVGHCVAATGSADPTAAPAPGARSSSTLPVISGFRAAKRVRVARRQVGRQREPVFRTQ